MYLYSVLRPSNSQSCDVSVQRVFCSLFTLTPRPSRSTPGSLFSRIPLPGRRSNATSDARFLVSKTPGRRNTNTLHGALTHARYVLNDFLEPGERKKKNISEFLTRQKIKKKNKNCGNVSYARVENTILPAGKRVQNQMRCAGEA